MSKEPLFHRKLAAILAADVVGYSRLMEADEVGTLRQVQAVQKTCIAPIAASYGGRLIKTTGDGFLFEFSSAVDATLFALALQKKLQADMASVAEAKRVVLRVGIHAGDVLSDGLDIFGDGVNVAARLETLCTPGGICMSAVVQHQLHGKVDLPLVDLGDHDVKNLTRSVRVFGIEATAIEKVAAVTPGGVATPPPPKRRAMAIAIGLSILVVSAGALFTARQLVSGSKMTETRQPQSLSLAVLPFTSSDTKTDDLADGLVDNLTTDLSIGFPQLNVISSASALTYRGKNIDPRQIGRELGVAYLLEGSIHRSSDSFRINVHLVEAETGAQRWSDQFEGSLVDIQTLQDQITSGIANTLSVQIVRVEADRRKYTTNASASDFLLRGWAIMNRPDAVTNIDLAEANFRQALVLDPGNLSAMEGIATALLARVNSNLMHVDAKLASKLTAESAESKQLLDRIRSQNPRYPDLHFLLGFFANLEDKPGEAAEHFRTEIEINPSAASAYRLLGRSLVMQGRAVDAVPLIEKSLRLDPRNVGIAGVYEDLAFAYFALANYREAIVQGERAYSLDPNTDNLIYLAAANAWAGNMAEARSRLAEARQLDPSLTVSGMKRNLATRNAGKADLDPETRIIEGLRRAGLPN